jgi:hypothetical protein
MADANSPPSRLIWINAVGAEPVDGFELRHRHGGLS